MLLPRDNIPKKPKELYSNTFIIERVDGYMGIRLDRLVKDQKSGKWQIDKNEKYYGVRLKTGEKYSKDKGQFS